MAKKGAVSLSESQFVDEIAARLSNSSLTRRQIGDVIKAFKMEAVDCLANGYKITLSGFCTITPSAKAGRTKGTVVRNPFDGTTKTLKADEPPQFKVKAKMSSSILKEFPTVRSADGQALVAQLTPAKKKATKKAVAA